MPQFGSNEEATVVNWRFAVGDFVTEGATLLEIETDKASVEIETPASGILSEILVQAGENVPIRTPLASIALSDEVASELKSVPQVSPDRLDEPSPSASEPSRSARFQKTPYARSSGESPVSPRARRLADSRGIDLSALNIQGTGPEGRIIERDILVFLESGSHTDASLQSPANDALRHTPLAAKMADDLGVDMRQLALGLPGSRIRSDDVLKRAVQTIDPGTLSSAKNVSLQDSPIVEVPVEEKPKEKQTLKPPETPVSPEPGYVVIPLSGLRRRIAENVTKSKQTIPHVTLRLEADMTACLALREQILDEFERLYHTRLTLTDLLIKALSRTLEAHPMLNSTLFGDEIHAFHHKNIGVAVAVEGGLLVPVLKNTENKTLGELSLELKSLIAHAKSGKSTPEELSGGTFTLTNLGAFGIDSFDPIIMRGQVGILGVGAVSEKPVVIQKEVVVRSMMSLCLSFDHRVLDGAPAAQFLAQLKETLENPVRLLL